jgi:hypothetical protein
MARLARFLAAELASHLLPWAMARKPDFRIGDEAEPYLRRWWLIPRNRWLNIYLHQIRRSDDDRALHDHPWPNASFVLYGHYYEHTIAAGGVHRRALRVAGDVKLRRARDAHRLDIGMASCWTLFLTGPVLRTWGFHCAGGWVPWTEFVDPADTGKVGRGCGEQA